MADGGRTDKRTGGRTDRGTEEPIEEMTQLLKNGGLIKKLLACQQIRPGILRDRESQVKCLEKKSFHWKISSRTNASAEPPLPPPLPPPRTKMHKRALAEIKKRACTQTRVHTPTLTLRRTRALKHAHTRAHDHFHSLIRHFAFC